MFRCGPCGPDATLPEDTALCPSEHVIAAFVAGLLPAGDIESIDVHLKQCEACFALVAASAAVADGGEAASTERPGGALARPGAPQLLSSRFEPLEILAWGATSVVYLGWDWLMGRPVAIKRLESRPGAEARECQRQFGVEAELLSRLHHPNVVRLVAAIPHVGGTDLVLEHADGSLRDLLRERTMLTFPRALKLLARLCDGLAHVHGLGIVHRDIKPDNVLLTRAEQPQLADFGSAQLLSSERAPGEIVGTVAYLSPEAARGGAVDARADLWALGVMLFEMLSGERPFRGHSQRATLRAVLEDPTPPLRRLGGVPVALGALVERLLEKDPARRLSSARQLAAELRAIQHNLERAPTSCISARAEAAAAPLGSSGSGRASFHGTRKVLQPLNAS